MQQWWRWARKIWKPGTRIKVVKVGEADSIQIREENKWIPTMSLWHTVNWSIEYDNMLMKCIHFVTKIHRNWIVLRVWSCWTYCIRLFPIPLILANNTTVSDFVVVLYFPEDIYLKWLNDMKNWFQGYQKCKRIKLQILLNWSLRCILFKYIHKYYIFICLKILNLTKWARAA